MTDLDGSVRQALPAGRRHYLLAAGVMTVLLAAFFAPVILRGETFSVVVNLQRHMHPWVVPGVVPPDPLSHLTDQADFVHPRQVFLHRSLKIDRRAPLWNPMTFGGHPFLAETGSRLAYPPLMYLSLLFDPTWTHDLYMVLHLLVAGIAAFALMRSFRVGSEGALLTGVAWAFSSYTLGWIQLEMFAAPAALLPIGLLCVRRWHDRRSWAWLLAGAFVMGLLFLGTTVETALFCFICVGAYATSLAMLRVVRDWRELTASRRVALLGAPAVLGLVGLAVAAVGLIPFLELSASSERSPITPFGFLTVPIENFRYVLTPPPTPQSHGEGLLALLSAKVFVGSATAVLAAVGLFLRRPGSALGRALVVVLFLFTIGSPFTSLAMLVIPQLKALTGHGRALFLWDLGVAVLGGLGLDALLRGLRARGARATGRRAGTAWSVAAGSIAAVCILVTGAQLLVHGRRINPPFQERSASQLYPPTPALGAVRSALGPYLGRGRVMPVFRPGGYPVLYAATNMAVDLPSAGGYEPVLSETVTKLTRVIAGEPLESALSTQMPRTYLTDFDAKLVRTDLLGRAGIAAVLGPPDIEVDPAWAPQALGSRGLRQTYAGPDATVYEVLDRPPRAAVVTEALWARSSPEALRRFVDASFDGRRQVVLEGEPSRQAPPAGPARASTPERVDWRDDRPDDIGLTVTSAEPGWLVLLDSWDPGWKATVNGRATDVIRANYNFRAVAVPAGSSNVRFSYRPTSVTVGGWVTVLSIAFIACAMVPEWARRRRAARRARRHVVAAKPESATPRRRR